MTSPAAALALARRFEGCRLTRYLCPAGIPTIGWGHVCAADQQPVTQEQADAWLEADMAKATAAALRQCPVLAGEPEGRLGALADFVFNLGAGRLQASTLRRRVNERDWRAAALELRRWVRGGGRVLPGLVARREAEVSLLLAKDPA